MMFVEFSFLGRLLQYATYKIDGEPYTTFSLNLNDSGFIRWTSQEDGREFLSRVHDGLNTCILITDKEWQ